MTKPQFYIITGTNGSGKSVYGNKLKKICNINFIDTDSLYKAKYGEYREYTRDEIIETSQEITKLRKYYFENKINFALEKILTNENNINILIDEAKKNNFEITLIYLGLDTLEESNRRIQERVKEGKHYVNPFIVEKNLNDCIQNFKQLKDKVDNVLIYDNSSRNSKIIYFTRDNVVKKQADNLPNWANELLTKELKMSVDDSNELLFNHSLTMAKQREENKNTALKNIMENTIIQGNPYKLRDDTVIMEHLIGGTIDNIKSDGLYIFTGKPGKMQPTKALSKKEAIRMIKEDFLNADNQDKNAMQQIKDEMKSKAPENKEKVRESKTNTYIRTNRS